MNVDLTNCLAKIRRAEEHLQSIEKTINGWHGASPYSFYRTSNAELTRHSLFVRLKTLPPFERLQLLAGDCAHALRSSLDHLVYAVAVHQSNADPPPDERRLQFPIADEPAEFKNQARRITTLSESVRREIETLQPYNRPNEHIPPILGILRDLDDSDKHRLPTVVISGFFEGEMRNLNYPIEPKEKLIVEAHTAAVENGTEMWAVTTPKPFHDLRFDLAVALGLCIRHRSGPPPRHSDHTEVAAFFRGSRNEVKLIIDRVSRVA